MYVMYVDESGDPGALTKPGSGNSQHFILSGLIVPFDDWSNCLEKLKIFRRSLQNSFGLPVRVELHATELISIKKIKAYRKIRKEQRHQILGYCIDEIPKIFSLSKIINICLDKMELASCDNFKILGWSRLIQRFDNYLKKSGSSKGIIVADGIEDTEVRGLQRKMRVYNPLPSRYGGYYDAPTNNIIEDIFGRDSRHSYFIQAVDAVAHCLYRREYPKGSLKKFNIDQLFERLEPLLLKEASESDPMGIVRK
jgi:hypothetical protein